MTAFQQMDSDLLGDPNISESITYWRNASAGFAAVSNFTLQGSPNMGGPYADPKGAFEGSVFFRVSDIPFGPQKGDRMTIPSLAGKTFFVQEIYKDQSGNWTEVRVRQQ